MSSANKKIKNARKNLSDGIKFKSFLEGVVYNALKEACFKPEYEKHKFILWKGIKPAHGIFYDRDKKTGLLKQNTKKLLDMTYTPDFTFNYKGIDVIIEVKGFENDVFPIKKKLFRGLLESWKCPVLYFEIYSKKQALQAIEIIKDYGNSSTNKRGS